MTEDNRRFNAIERLYSAKGVALLQRSHVAVIGIGGVGSWVAEALARSAIGKLTLIDLDDICVTNINRQIHALEETVGEAKVFAMANRIQAINPKCDVQAIEDFLLAENINEYLVGDFDYVVDATDSIQAKAAIVAHCKRNKIPVITIGGAGGQIDPTQIVVSDLAKTTQDPLAAKLRSQLRRQFNFSKNPKRRFGVECVYSTEQLRYPQPDGSVAFNKVGGESRLDCATGFGSAVVVTANFGFVAASRVINKLLQKVDSA